MSRIVSMMMALMLSLFVCAAEKKKTAKKKEEKPWPGPYLNLEPSKKFMDLVSKYDDLKYDMDDLDPSKDKSKIAGIKKKMEKNKEKVDRLIKSQNRAVNKELKRIEKGIKQIEKQLEGIGDDQKKEAALTKRLEKLEKEQSEYDSVLNSYEMFANRCSNDKKKDSLLKDTAFSLEQIGAPELKGTRFGKDGAYSLEEDAAKLKIIVFCSTKHSSSMKALTDMTSYAGSKKATVVAVCVDEDESDIKDAFGKKSPFPVIQDKDKALCRKYKVMFLPQVVAVDKGGDVLAVTVGYTAKTKNIINSALKRAVKEAKEMK